jgi:hypothetical protein
MRIPYRLLKKLPMWMCENKHFFNDSLTCPVCGKPRIPPDLSFYVHKVLLPKLSPAEREEWLKYFTTIFAHGFEGGDFGTDPNTGYAWTGTKVLSGCSLTVVTEQAHHGSYSAKAVVTSGELNYPACSYITFTEQTTLFARAYVRWASFPTSAGRDQVLETLATTMGVKNDAGTMKWDFWYVTGVATWNEIVVASPTPQLDTWYCLEVKVVKGTSGEVRFYIDGNEVASATNIDTSQHYNNEVDVGLTYTRTAETVYVDCVVVADAYIGPEVPPKPKGSIVIHAKLAGVI